MQRLLLLLNGRGPHDPEPVGGLLHAMAGGRGIKLARNFQILGYERRRTGFIEFSQLELGGGMIGGGGCLEQGQCAGKVRRGARSARNTHNYQACRLQMVES